MNFLSASGGIRCCVIYKYWGGQIPGFHILGPVVPHGRAAHSAA